ncbi:hypothetical protein [Brachybacterium kimchii]|uniref:Uncharacterized protein n=1 Tax=Brachybacterium kimchii TaxID=2942909 RepID=A0ABY4NDR9_9MICO|nr:hypothetical protein [Brachybacterium kimchii]UQN31820.1 hypothetical protein M4486_19715 [Brachybacterium kimchii]
MSKEVSLRNKIRKNDVPQRTAAESTKSAPTTPAPASVSIPEEDLVRKEFRVRPDQILRLARLRRRINTARRTAQKDLPAKEAVPSMTDRILARVAIDYLLEHEDSLTGWTEQDLLESLRHAQD